MTAAQAQAAHAQAQVQLLRPADVEDYLSTLDNPQQATSVTVTDTSVPGSARVVSGLGVSRNEDLPSSTLTPLTLVNHTVLPAATAVEPAYSYQPVNSSPEHQQHQPQSQMYDPSGYLATNTEDPMYLTLAPAGRTVTSVHYTTTPSVSTGSNSPGRVQQLTTTQAWNHKSLQEQGYSATSALKHMVNYPPYSPEAEEAAPSNDRTGNLDFTMSSTMHTVTNGGSGYPSHAYNAAMAQGDGADPSTGWNGLAGLLTPSREAKAASAGQ